MEQVRRLALLCLAVVMAVMVFLKGHGPSRKDASMAFLVDSASISLVMVAGDVSRPGVYQFSDAPGIDAVIKLTGLQSPLMPENKNGTGTMLRSGSKVTIYNRGGQYSEMVTGRMSAHEKILLQFPLDPDELSEAEWEVLPGIGPAMARRIMADRQEYGAFGSIEGVLRVAGMGKRTLGKIDQFFVRR